VDLRRFVPEDVLKLKPGRFLGEVKGLRKRRARHTAAREVVAWIVCGTDPMGDHAPEDQGAAVQNPAAAEETVQAQVSNPFRSETCGWHPQPVLR